MLFCQLLALSAHLLAQVLLSLTASKSCHQRFWSDGARRHSPQQVGQQNSSLRIQIRQIFTPPCSMVRMQPQLGSTDEQSCWVGLLFGPSYEQSCWLGLLYSKYTIIFANMNAVFQDLCVGFCKPLPPSQSDSQWLSLTDSR